MILIIPVVERINRFRKEKGLPTRKNYVPGSVTYEKDGRSVKVKSGKIPLSKKQKNEAKKNLSNNN